MDGLLLVARLVLAAIFLVAAATKLLNRQGTVAAVEAFGAPLAVAPAIAFVLPLAELAVAVALIPTRTAWLGSIGALVLLAVFMAAIGINLSLGRRPSCNCFGQLSSSPIGLRTLARNAVFAAIGLFIAVGGHGNAGTNLNDWLDGLSTANRIGLAAVIVGGVLVVTAWRVLYELLKQNGRLLARVEALEEAAAGMGFAPAPLQLPESPFGLAVGTPAPTFSLPDIKGNTISLENLLARGKPILLVFTNPNCLPCKEVQKNLLDRAGLPDRAWPVFISAGDAEESRAKLNMISGPTILVEENGTTVLEAYGAPGMPGAVLIDTDGKIATPLFAGTDDIAALADFLLAPSATGIPLLDQMPMLAGGNGHRAPGALYPGDSVPSIVLPNLEGETVDLAEITRGRRTMLIFWNTGCGFCQDMIPELKDWERKKPGDAPEIVLISAGSAEDLRETGFRSTALMDPTFSVSDRFGADGTPMAILIDEDGKVASGLATGAGPVLTLAR
ncbi:MAG TPA: MauE/DoxX family redox-associated membrane protein [Chloroflexota bacterium]|nr:MauE/DoxX family redox-associated membrane protein [Chloroflexota bacterium]